MNHPNPTQVECCEKCLVTHFREYGQPVWQEVRPSCRNPSCPCHHPSQPTTVEERFQFFFCTKHDDGKHYISSHTGAFEVMVFIGEEIERARREGFLSAIEKTAAKVEGMKIPVRENVDGPYRLKTDVVHNSALEEIRTLLTQLQDQQQGV